MSKSASGSHTDFLPALSSVLSGSEAVWDVLGLGQAMVDFSAAVDDAFLEQLGVEKGGRKIISVEERAKILALLDGSAYQVQWQPTPSACSQLTIFEQVATTLRVLQASQFQC